MISAGPKVAQELDPNSTIMRDAVKAIEAIRISKSDRQKVLSVSA